MAAKISITLRAAKARLNRKLQKEGKKLTTFRTPIDGYGWFGIVDLNSNLLSAYGDLNTLKSWMAKDAIIKPYETIEL